jgi:hypothetical protein
MVRVATPACKQKFEIMIDGIDKFDRLPSPGDLEPLAYLEAEANCRTVLMKVDVARV